MLAQFTFCPVLRSQQGEDLARVIRVLEDFGLEYEVGPMGTCVSGDWSEVMFAIGECYREMRQRHGRVVATILIEDGAAKPLSQGETAANLETHFDHPVEV